MNLRQVLNTLYEKELTMTDQSIYDRKRPFLKILVKRNKEKLVFYNRRKEGYSANI